MRCTEARRKLIESSRTGKSIAYDKELLDHLKDCPACALEAEAAQILRQDFTTAAEPDIEGGLPLQTLKSRIEAKTAQNSLEHQTETHIMAKITAQFKQRPRFSIGMAAIALVVLLSVLIPFKYQKPVGYEVAFAAADSDVTINEAGVKDFLARLGAGDASIDLSDSGQTCILRIKDIKSAREAQVITAAFEKLPHVEMSQGITPVWQDESGTIVELTANKIALFLNKEESKEQLTKLVLERLGENYSPHIVWVREGTGGSADSIIHISADSATYLFIPEESTGIIKLSGDSVIEIREIPPQSGGRHFRFIHEDGTVDSGVVNPDGSFQSNDSADKEADVELPEGFELSQNYPNPFNPTTRIDYSVPSAEYVRLEILNISGQIVRTLVDRTVSAGAHSVEWNATDDSGAPVASGIYLYRLTAGDISQTKKMSYVK